MRRILGGLLAILVALCGRGADAAEWPVKPVRIVVSYAPGGAADTLGRLFADVLGAALGKAFYVENRPGGGSIVGSEVAK